MSTLNRRHRNQFVRLVPEVIALKLGIKVVIIVVEGKCPVLGGRRHRLLARVRSASKTVQKVWYSSERVSNEPVVVPKRERLN